MVTWSLEINSGKRRRSEEKISVLRESKLFQSILVLSSNSRTFRRWCCWSCIARQSIVTERIFRVYLPRWKRVWIEFHKKEMDKFQEEKASREEDKRYSSLQWIRWMMDVVWEKLHAIWRNQGSRHTRILGNEFKILYFGAIWSSLKRKACNFTKLGHMQSFSTTHHLPLALRMRYVWRHRMSSTRRFAQLRGCHVSN